MTATSGGPGHSFLTKSPWGERAWSDRPQSVLHYHLSTGPQVAAARGEKNRLTDDLQKEIKQPGRKWSSLLVVLLLHSSWWRKVCLCESNGWLNTLACASQTQCYHPVQAKARIFHFILFCFSFLFVFAMQTSSGSTLVALELFSFKYAGRVKNNVRNGNKKEPCCSQMGSLVHQGRRSLHVLLSLCVKHKVSERKWRR